MGKLWKKVKRGMRGITNRRLLDRLRRDPHVILNEFDFFPGPMIFIEDKITRMKLILDHLSDFPLKLRRPIQDAKEMVERTTPDYVPRKQRPRRQARAFENAVDNLVKDFLFGRYQTDHYNNTWSDWHGCDSSVDTEDQVELVLRCFPHLAKQHSAAMARVNTRDLFIDQHPIFFLTSSSEAVSFVPLFAKITGELPRDVLEQLFCNTLRQLEFQQEPCKELDEACLAALEELRRLNMVTRRDLAYMIGHLWRQKVSQKGREFAFLESRLRLVLQDWGQHSLLEACIWNDYIDYSEERYRSTSLMGVCCYWDDYHSYESKYHFERYFGLLVELGMLYYPHKIGFVFHDLYGKRYFCKIPPWRRNVVLRVLDRELDRYFENDSSGDPNRYETRLRELVIEAATNRDIALDGVYTLLRRDPLAMVPKSYKTTSTVL